MSSRWPAQVSEPNLCANFSLFVCLLSAKIREPYSRSLTESDSNQRVTALSALLGRSFEKPAEAERTAENAALFTTYLQPINN